MTLQLHKGMSPQEAILVHDTVRRMYHYAHRLRLKQDGVAPNQSEQAIGRALTLGTTYLVSEYIFKHVLPDATVSLPLDTMIDASLFPTPRGVMLFEGNAVIELPKEKLRIGGLVWDTCVVATRPGPGNDPDAPTAPGVLVCALSDTRDNPVMRRFAPLGPRFYATWRFDQDLYGALRRAVKYSTTRDDDPEGITTNYMYRALAAMLLFMKQELVTRQRVNPDARTSKELRRNQSPVSFVNVVRLRKPRHNPHTSGTHRHIDWSYRWVVRSHWHTYRVGPGRSQRRRIYLMPYPKGPDDKPLREKPTVFSVSC